MIRLAVTVKRDLAELALAELMVLAPAGVEEVDLGEYVEYAVYGSPGEVPELPDLEAAVGVALVKIATTEVADGWDSKWRDFHRPVLVGDRVYIRPPWHTTPSDSKQLEVVIDPGQAFGTGAHPTTRLCLELLLKHGDSSGGLVDLGCGSGVLAIAAAKLGFKPVTALDYDSLAVTATQGNATINGVSLTTDKFDLRSDQLPSLAGEVLVANLLRPLLLELAERLKTTPRLMIISGLLTTETDLVTEAFAQARDLVVLDRLDEGEWSAAALVPK